MIDGKLLKLMLPTTRDSIGLTLTPCEDGLLVAHVEDNSVGDVVGLKAGDIIFKVRYKASKSPLPHASQNTSLLINWI